MSDINITHPADGVWHPVEGGVDMPDNSSALSAVLLPSEPGDDFLGAAASDVPPLGLLGRWCNGTRLCPWCALSLSRPMHGDLRYAGQQVMNYKAQLLTQQNRATREIEGMCVSAMHFFLQACAHHKRHLEPGDDTEEIVVDLRNLGLLPPLPPTEAEDAEASGSGGGGTRSRSRKKASKTYDWEDPADAEWRRDEWIRRSPLQARRIKVFCGAKTGYVDLPPDTTQELLAWYDQAQILEEKAGVSVLIEGQTFYFTYRYEGGKYLTQRNPNRANERRECIVYYAEGTP